MKYFAPTKISENIRKTPEGYLLCIGVSIGRTGEMEYGPGETPLEVGDSNRVLVTRSEEDLFRPATIASFEGKPFTISHPSEFVDPDNWSTLAKGVIKNVRRGEGEDAANLVADILVTDARAIEMIEAGVREVSCGYEAEYEQVERGKGKQFNIVGNHLALVEEGRAGPSYAINDHKGKGISEMKNKLQEKLKAIFAKTTDEAAKVLDEMSKEEGKKDEAKDGEVEVSLDAVYGMMQDLKKQMDALCKPEAKDADKDEPAKEDKAKDAEEDKPAAEEGKEKAKDSVEDRLAALEAMVAKIMEKESAEESSDEESEEDMVTEDEDEEAVVETGDSAEIASRAEILAPGIEITKDVKAKALKTAYTTKDGKAAIDKLTGGKALTFDSAEKTDAMFIAVSELLKVSRASDFSKSKQVRDTAGAAPKGAMTPEKINQLNAERFKQTH